MRLSLRFGLLAVVSLFLFLGLASNTVFSASHVVECSTDIAQENKERQLILSCMPGFGTDYDQVLITSLSEPFDPSQPWSSNVDYTDEIWELDAGADGSIQLAIEFQRAAETIVASIFDDMDGDGQIRTRIVGGRLEVDEAPYPPLRVIVNGDWFLAGGQPNWNVRFVTDGASIPHIHNYVLTRAMDRYFVLDGQPDSELEFVDEDNDGVPERALWRVTATLPERAGFGRSCLLV